MRVVLDTNIIVISLTSRSPYHTIFTSLVSKKFDLVISNAILLEYQEIITVKYGEKTALLFLELFNELSNIHFINPSYHWDIIESDKDDNKFVDCAIAGYADFIVTEDHHFDILQKISFPAISVINTSKFLDIINSESRHD